jgi:uncharacterized repeat protein (TIGR03803 family)
MSFTKFTLTLAIFCSAELAACSGGNSTPSNFTIGGTVSGLASGTGVVLLDNGANNTTVSANGNFAFSIPVVSGAGYAVTVLTQPAGQTCKVSAGGGTVGAANVTSVRVTCAVSTFTISGTVSGLDKSASLTLQNNAGDPLVVKANGTFTFAKPMTLNGSYAVTIGTDPPARSCTVTAGTGSSVTKNITSVSVACSPASLAVIHAFNPTPDGAGPRGTLVKGSDGNFYGTTYGGGNNNVGIVFRITPSGTETVLYRFSGPPTDGATPAAGLIRSSDGNFYGTTSFGGSANLGTAFKITPAGVETLLHSFTVAEGASPVAPLLQGIDGNLYGTNQIGGTSPTGGTPYGSVFKITPSGVETTLHTFTGGFTDGDGPQAAVVQDAAGNLYGTTNSAGQRNDGTIFKMTSTGVETIFHSFAGGPTDGAYPIAPLLRGADGSLYGVTLGGGTYGFGTVFAITPAGSETVLHSFAGGTLDGELPESPLILGQDGNFYGSANNGPTGNGVIFKLTPAGTEELIYTFKGSPTDASTPGGLVQDSDGSFYGIATTGGASGSGGVFKLSPTGDETLLYSFFSTSEGADPVSVVQGTDGSFYVTTASGGTHGSGTLTRITPTGVETVIVSLSGYAIPPNPLPVAQGSDGNFYGTTPKGGAFNSGAVVKITPAGVQTVLHSFKDNSVDGYTPQAPLIQGRDGNFYGTTSAGGRSNQGTVFKITPAGVETVLHSFSGGKDGIAPIAALVEGSDGNFYGTTSALAGPEGGYSFTGTAFKITPAGEETVLHTFAGGTTDGVGPAGALIQATDGNFYGATSYGGAGGAGTVFRLTPAGAETLLYAFSENNDGGIPIGAMIQANDGNFYGITQYGVSANTGTLFRVTPAGVETVLHAFVGGATEGSHPNALILGTDGHFYGTTSAGGISNYGTFFRF